MPDRRPHSMLRPVPRHRRAMAAGLVALALLLLPALLPAATYYISSSSGSNGNSGLAPDAAWADFAPVNALTLQPGDQVLLRRGDAWPAARLDLTGKGTPEQPILLSAWGSGANPLITGINLTDAACVILQNPSWFNVESLDLRDAKVGIYLRFAGGNTDGTGAMFRNAGVSIRCCNFRNMDEEWSDGSGDISVPPPFELSWGAGVWVGGSIPSPPGGPWPAETTPILDGLDIRHCAFEDCSTGVGSAFYFPSVVYRERFTNVVLEDLWVTGCENGAFAMFFVSGAVARRVDTWLGGDGFYATGTTAAFLQNVENFVVDDCEFAFNKRPSDSNDGVGFDFEGDCLNSTLTNCVIHDNDGGGLLILDSPNPPGLDNIGLTMNANTFWNNCRDPKPDSSSQNKVLRYPNSGSTGTFANNGVYLGVDVGSGGLAVYDSSSRWNDFSPTGNRTGTSWASVAGRPTVWTFDSGVEGWGNENQWNGFGATGGALTGTSAGVDPFVEGPATWVNTRARRWVRIRMSVTAGQFGQVFFQTETDAAFTGPKSAAFALIPDGQMHDYVVDLGRQSALYKGVVTRWRIDPTDVAGASIAIDTFEARADAHLSAAATIGHHTIDVVFNMPMRPQGGVMTPANFALTGSGRGTLSATPDHVSQVCAPFGPVYRLGWDGGAFTAGDLIVTVHNAQNARGVPIAAPGNVILVNRPTTAHELWGRY